MIIGTLVGYLSIDCSNSIFRLSNGNLVLKSIVHDNYYYVDWLNSALNALDSTNGLLFLGIITDFVPNVLFPYARLSILLFI
jgi:hypothetical protein